MPRHRKLLDYAVVPGMSQSDLYKSSLTPATQEVQKCEWESWASFKDEYTLTGKIKMVFLEKYAKLLVNADCARQTIISYVWVLLFMVRGVLATARVIDSY